MKKLKDLLLKTLLGLFMICSAVAAGTLIVVVVALAVTLPCLKVYGLYVIVCLLTGWIELGLLEWYQAIALVSLLVPFRVVVKEKQ